MDFTISQIGSVTNLALRPVQAGSGVRSAHAEPPRPVDAIPSPAATGLVGLDTEYDQFGRFAPGASAAVDADPSSDEEPGDDRPPLNPSAKYFRAGKVTVQEVEREYNRSLIDSYVADADGGVRRFIPAGMTEYQVNQLSGYQYRWALETERRALERAVSADATPPASADDAAGPGAAGTADAPR